MFRFDAAFRTELKKNWMVLAIAFSCLLFGFSAPAFALPFLFPEVIAEFGWTRAEATLLASAKYATGAAAALLVGRFIDVTGVWVALIFTVGVGGAAMVSFLWVTDLNSYYLAGVMLGFAGPGAMVAVKVLVSRTFHASQGTAMGLALLGTSLGSVIVPIIISALLVSLGWRIGFAALSLGIWVVAMPMLLVGLFSKSLTMGRRIEPSQRSGARRADGTQPAKVWSLMTRTPFWLITGAVFIAALVDQAFIQHQVLILNDLDMPRELVALGISAIGLIGIIARVVIGNVLDSRSNKGLSLLYLTLTASSLIAFLLVNPLIFMAFVVLRAVGHAAVLLDTTVMAKHVFGLPHLGTLLGIYTAVVSAGFAVGPWLMGLLYDMSASYASSFILFGILPIIAAVLIWFVKPTYWLEINEKARSSRLAADNLSPAPSAGNAA